MASPGSFTSGAVLTAAEMNALPGGLLASTTVGDVTVTTALTDIGNVTFTLDDERQVLIVVSVGLIDQVSANLGLQNVVRDANAAGSATTLWAQHYQYCATGFNNSTTHNRLVTLSAGTYTMYWVAATSTGTARLNDVPSQNSRNQLIVLDVGP